MGDRIALLRNGVLQQLGTPQELYNRPANLFAATFLGSPAMNLFQATIRKGGDGLAVDIGSQCIPLPSIAVNGHLSEYVGRRIAVGVRPEHMIEPSAVRAGHQRIRGEVVMVETLGSERLVHLRVAAEPVVTDDLLEVARDVDVATVEALRDEVREGAMVAVARFDADAAVSAGGPQEAAIRPDKIHFFDLETGMAIR